MKTNNISRSISRPITNRIYSQVNSPQVRRASGPTYLAETLAYQTRVEAAGGTMTADGLALVDAIFANAVTQGITIQRGYVFGTAVNLNAATRTILEMTGNGQSFVADSSSNDSTVHVGLGSLCHDGTTAQQGYFALSSDQLFTNTDWTMLVYFQKPLIDTTGSGVNGQILSQYSTSAAGNVVINAGITGNVTFQPIGGGTSINFVSRNTTHSGGSIIEPVPMFITYNSATRAISIYDPLTPQLNTGGVMPVNFLGSRPTRLGAAQIATAASNGPRGQGYFGILKYDGILTTTQMDSIWSTFKTYHQKICNYVLIYGNSVTSGADAQEGGLNSARNWPHQFSRVALRNNCITIRPFTMGGKQLYYMRDTDFVKPTGSSYPGSYAAVTLSPTYAQDSVNYWGPRWSPNILVLDENQNTAANASVNVTYAIDWAGTEGNPGIARHVINKLRGYNSDLVVVAGTMLAVGPDGKSYATIIAEETSIPSKWRKNLRDWSAAIRADTEGLYDAVYDLYTDFNLGWGSDGNAADPTNDYPNGNPTLFYDDHQHPNLAGHTLMTTGYWTAVNSVRLY